MEHLLVTSSWDDGAVSDLRLAKLLKKYHIPATFYIPLTNKERKVLPAKDIQKLSQDFEIGCHGMTHRSLTQLPSEEIFAELVNCKKKLEKISKRKITSFCYPQGRTSSIVKQLVGEAGFTYARTTTLFSTTIGDILLAPTTIHAYNHNPLVYLRYGLEKKLGQRLFGQRKLPFIPWDILAMEALDYCIKNGGIFHLWGHSWEIDAHKDWKRLEKVLAYIDKKIPRKNRVTNQQMLRLTKTQKEMYYKNSKAELIQKSYETWFYKKELQFIKNLIGTYDKKDMKVLDLGCGTGRVSTLFKKAEYTGIDFVESFVMYAKKKWKGNNSIFLTAKFDSFKKNIAKENNLIIIWGLFEDETNPFLQIAKLEKHLASNGRIIFTLHNLSNPFFVPLHVIKTEWMNKSFPYTSFSYSFVENQVKNYAMENGYTYDIKTFGLLPPINPKIPPIPGHRYGTTLCIVLDKI